MTSSYTAPPVPSRGVQLILRAGADTWTNMPAADTEYLGNAFRRLSADLTGYTQIRAHVAVVTAGATGATLKLQYTTDLSGATGWTDLASAVSIAATGLTLGSWETIPAAARTEVLIRALGNGGDATADPAITGVAALVKP